MKHNFKLDICKLDRADFLTGIIIKPILEQGTIDILEKKLNNTLWHHHIDNIYWNIRDHLAEEFK